LKYPRLTQLYTLSLHDALPISMKSVASQIWPHVRDGQAVQLFKSYREGVPDGGQKRDFVYVRDVAEVTEWLTNTPEVSGIFNLGDRKSTRLNSSHGSISYAVFC